MEFVSLVRRRSPSRLFPFLILVLCVPGYAQTQNQSIPPSPCPQLFQYLYEGVECFGFLLLNGVQLGQTIRLNVNLSLRDRLPTSYPGALELFFPREKTIQNIVENKTVLYRVRFPVQNPLPRLTEILLNNQIICSGPPDTGPLVTAIHLEHSLYTQVDGQPLANQIPTQDNQIYIPESGQLGLSHIGSNNNLGSVEVNSNANTNLGGRGSFQYATEPSVSVTDEANTQSAVTSSTKTPLKLRHTPPPPIPQSKPGQTNSQPNPIQSEVNTSSQLQADNDAGSGETSKLDKINKVCGVPDSKYNVKPLVVGGEDIKRGSWPWLVAIFFNTPASLSYQCGGNVISNRLVLTSAHCFYTNYKKYPAQDVIVFLGRHNILSWDEKGWISSSADGVYTHPDYKNDNVGFDADIALILLKNEITFNEYIRPVCLWPRVSTTEEIEGETGVVVGWGRNEADQRITETPKRIETTVVSDVECLRSNEQFRLLTSNRTFCAGNRDGNGPCAGDSGGGLMIYRNKRWWIRGTVSASLLDSKRGSCNLNEYIVYVDVSKFLDWIKSFMLL